MVEERPEFKKMLLIRDQQQINAFNSIMKQTHGYHYIFGAHSTGKTQLILDLIAF